MLAYIVRRVLYAIPILVGVNLVPFALFFVVNTPDDMARMQLGAKRVTPEAIDKWKEERGYNKPLLFNSSGSGSEKITETIFFEKSVRLFAFDFGAAGRPGGQHHVRHAHGVLPRNVPRCLGRGAVCRDDVGLHAFLHHRR